MRKKVVLAVSLAVFAAASILMEITSCTGKSGDASVIKTIKVGDYQEDNFDWKSVFEQDLHLVELTDTSKEYSFTEISKLVFKKDKFYISDWATRRIIVLDLNGNPVFVLNRRGRGPEEYLQVTDFDVDIVVDYGFWMARKMLCLIIRRMEDSCLRVKLETASIRISLARMKTFF